MSDFRPMNDSTMPPPKPRIGSVATSTPHHSKSSSKKSTRLPTTARRKVGVRKGFGMYDWTRLLRCSGDLAQRKGAPLRPISRAEIREHGFEYDAWIILHGKVYNVTPYLAYHPGGIDIMKGVLGGDATVLFEKFHRWVNVNG